MSNIISLFSIDIFNNLLSIAFEFLRILGIGIFLFFYFKKNELFKIEWSVVKKFLLFLFFVFLAHVALFSFTFSVYHFAKELSFFNEIGLILSNFFPFKYNFVSGANNLLYSNYNKLYLLFTTAYNFPFVFWEDIIFGGSIYYVLRKQTLIPYSWFQYLLVFVISLVFGFGHLYQGTFGFAIASLVPYFVFYKYGTKYGFGTTGICHIIYDFFVLFLYLFKVLFILILSL